MSLRGQHLAGGTSRTISTTEPAGADAPGMLAASCAEILGADAALLSMREPGEEPQLLGRFGPFLIAVPDSPFLLADKAGQGPRLDRTTAQGRTWLHIGAPVHGGGELVLSLCFTEHQSARQAEGASGLAWPALLAFASAIETGKEARARVASYEAALNLSELGILLLRRDGTLLFANRMAEALLQKEDCLRRSGSSIAARDIGDAVKLQVAIEHVCQSGGAEIEDPVVALRRKGSRPVLLCISPAAGEHGTECEAGAVLRVIDPDRELKPMIEPVCGLYRLSPVETRLACLLAEGETLESGAAAMRIKVQTARSYLKQIFIKTDTNRQCDLVRLMLTSLVRTLPLTRFKLL